MTSREAFESTILNSRSIWIFDEKSNSYPQSGHVQATWVVWQAAIEWSSKLPRNTVIDGATTEWFVQWIRNNYQDHPNIASLCDAMREAAHGIKEQR